MDYSEELAAISKPAYRLQKVGHLAVTVAFLAMAAFFLLGAIGLLNEWVGLSSRPRGQWPFLAMMAAAPLIGGGLASLGLFFEVRLGLDSASPRASIRLPQQLVCFYSCQRIPLQTARSNAS